MDDRNRSTVLLAVALIAGAVFEQVVEDEGTALGLSDTELMFLGTGVGALVRRVVRRRRAAGEVAAAS